MSDPRCLSDLTTARHLVGEHRTRHLSTPIQSVALWGEGHEDAGVARHLPDALLPGPWVWRGSPVAAGVSPMWIGFAAVPGCSVAAVHLNHQVDALERLGNEVLRTLATAPTAVRNALALPHGADWWRTLYHLAWHGDRRFLSTPRQRLWEDRSTSDEKFVQFFGTGGRRDRYPGLLQSQLAHDVATVTEAAVTGLIAAVQSHESPAAPSPPAGGSWAEIRAAFEGLDGYARRGSRKLDTTATVYKAADSFRTAPASEWGGYVAGGVMSWEMQLSALNADRECVVVRGPAANGFREWAARAGTLLGAGTSGDGPVLFHRATAEDGNVGGIFSIPRSVLNDEPAARWVRFVFRTLRRHVPEAVIVRWVDFPDPGDPLLVGTASFDRNPFAASLRALDLLNAGGDSGRALADVRPSPLAERSPPPVPPNHFRTHGNYYNISFQGDHCMLKKTAGLQHIAALLAGRSRSIEATTLMALRSGKPELRSDGLDVSDPQAMREYEAQYKRLQTRLDEAVENHDSEEEQAVREEQKILAQELRKGKGRHGRIRKTSDVDERARSAVTKALKRAYEEIEASLPALAVHFRQFIATGSTIRYEPKPNVEWDLG